MKKNIILFAFSLCGLKALANNEDVQNDSKAIVTNSFWDNWFVQLGIDMWLQNPYGCNFMNVFPNGKTFGVDAAIGKWFTSEYGVRAKLNWEYGIIKSDHASWVNTKKGYVAITGDFLVNVNNLLGNFNPSRKWNVNVFPRAGVLMNIHENNVVGSPLIGAGFGGTYRINDRWSVYGDVAYQMASSALGLSTENSSGSSSNGYFDFNIGVQFNLGESRFYSDSKGKEWPKNSVRINSFWDNWFVQAGIGMSLINAYGCNFSHVFPNGSTFGISAGMGKWLTPEYGLRVGVNWQNGLIGNKRLSWLDKNDKPGSNHDAGGFVVAYADMLFNLHNLFMGYDENRRWNAIVYPRAGIGHNFDVSDSSPNVGIGTEQTYRLNDRISLYADIAYHFTSGGFMGDDHQSSHLNGGSNGFFLIDLGVKYELGQAISWHKPNMVHGEGLTVHDSGFRVKDGHNWPRFIVNTIGSVGVAYIGKTVLKAMIKEERPDHTDNKSFPSGHAAMAFAAARSIDKEFRKDCIWIPIASYAAATAIGIERVASDRHHWYDVVAGAAVGYGAAELTWWLSDLLFGKGGNVAVGSSGNTVDVAVTW